VKNDGSLRQRRAVIRAVLHYVIKNPDAKDTIEGVRQWWLPEDYREQGQEQVEEILNFLVTKNWLTLRMTSQQRIYGLNKTRLKEIKVFLEKFQIRQKTNI
jgi:hypothetical protein